MTISIRTKGIHADCQPKPRSIWARFGQYFALRRQRQQIVNLEDHLLDDIGITRAEAYKESRKSAWDVPNYWHR